jgi:ribosomal protein S21
MVDAKRKPNENVASLLRRFSEYVKKSGLMEEARQAKFRLKSKSRRLQRQETLNRLKIKSEIEKLKKLGKFDEIN